MDDSLFEDFVAWIERVNKSDSPPNGIIAFNFGLFETDDGYLAYLVGSDRYDAQDEDWACSEDWSPKERYFYPLAKVSSGANWKDVLSLIVSLAKRFLDSPEYPNSFLANSIITAGFDDGNLVRVA